MKTKAMTDTLRRAGLAAALIAMPYASFAAEPGTADAMFKVPTADFVTMVTSSNAFEILSSEIANQKASSADVKEFAAHMITDHTKAGEELKAALGQAPDAAPEGSPLSPKHAGMIALLEKAEGGDFEMLYIDMQAGAHMEAVELFRTYSKSGDDAKVVAFAQATLPVLQQHEAHIMEIVAKH